MTSTPTPTLPPVDTRTPDGGAADPPAPLVSAWRARAEAGEPVAVVRVRDLQGSGAVPVGRDAWGRAGRPQPVLLSAEISFARPFAAASADDDRLGADTAHYGNLSKALLGALELCGPSGRGSSNSGGGDAQPKDQGQGRDQQKGDAPPPPPALLASSDVFELLWVRMTGRVVDGSRVELPPDQVPFLPDPARLRALSLTMRLPKASLLGAGGVSLTTTACFREGLAAGDGRGEDEKKKKSEEGGTATATATRAQKNGNPLSSYSRTLRLHGLHVPTLIGVNENERKARQMVVADVEIDRYDVHGDDIHAELERTVVEVSRPRNPHLCFFFFFPCCFPRRSCKSTSIRIFTNPDGQ